MKKSFRIACLLVFLTSPLMLLAQQVSSELAKQKALTFLTKSDKSSTKRSASNKTPRLVLANDRDEFYVFNDEANGGYVVVSGDERMPDVLGYSYTGHFDAETIPCNMRAWLEDYANQVKYLRAHPEVPASRRTATEREEISPLLKCHFDQGKYYNEKCPIVDGEHCYTGCVATTMAQIMYYYQWPKQTTDIIPGYTSGTRKIDMPALPVMTIDWDNISEQYLWWEYYSDGQIDAISTLMLLCGTSIEMDYDLGGSGAELYNAAMALSKYFDYDDSSECVDRNDWVINEWEQILYNELNDGRPVLYDGYLYEGDGHAFVIDGYRDSYFHVNWGWGGSQDDYFLLTDLNGYNYGQGAVVGIQPAYPDKPRRYAVLDNGKVTLYYDKEKANRSGTILPHKEDWSNYKDKITLCVIDSSFANLEERDLSYFFGDWKQLKSITGLENLNTSRVIDMGGMFSGCSSLTSLDVNGFKTENVRYMNSMFQGCSSLTNLDVSGFKTDNVEDMGNMFYNCSSLKSLDVSGLNTSNVTDMGGMFCYCSSLKNLDLSGFNTGNVRYMEFMFCWCSDLSTIYASEHWDMSKVVDASNMFYGCDNIKGGAGTTYNYNTWAADPSTGSVIAERDWTGGFEGDYPYWYQFDDSQTDGSVTSNPDGIAITVDKNVGKYWEPQVMVLPNGSFNLELVGYYKVVITAKFPSDGWVWIRIGGWEHYDHDYIYVESTGDFQEIEFRFPEINFNEDSCFLLFQCGDFEGITIVKKIQVWKMDTTGKVSDVTFAHIDGGPEDPGYFTYKAPRYFTITYMIDGEPYTTAKLEYGAEIQAPNPPAREGYDFAWIDLPETMPDHDITIYGSYTSGIKDLQEEKHPVKVFSLEGKAQNKMQKGINIIRYSDGSVRKVLVK